MKYLIALSIALLSSTSLYAAGDAAAGKTKAATCVACHGADGKATIVTYPSLAGQNIEYMVAQLKAFQSGERKGASSALMAPMAASLSEQDMVDIAAYFNSL